MDKIKVAIRARPLNKRELSLGSSEAVIINDNQIVLTNLPTTKDGRKATKTFTYDCCFDSTSADKPNYAGQEDVFNSLGIEILENTFAGYNACVFAYGQTGSGKSYTMTGSEENRGIIPRICEAIFERVDANKDTNCTYKIEVYYMEIYNEKCRDLLNPSQKNLKVREHQLLGSYVEGLSQLAVSSFKDIEVLMNEGNKSRTIASTNMNSESSRSHAVFCVKLSQNIVDEKCGISGEKVSRLSLVDLAGSEKASKTGSEGDRLKEGCNINRSLLTLGIVISTLADNSQNKSKQKHIPYRDSVLTWLLKDSLGGNSKTVMVTTISTAYDNYDETLSTLRYADRAKRIVNNAVINEDPNAKIIRNLREELEMLKKELEKAKEKINSDALNDRLKESETLYNEMSKSWTVKLAETEKVQQDLSQRLQTMGISVQSSGISVEKDKYYLVNINPDPSMNELLVYYLKDLTLVGRPECKNKQDIQLVGPGILLEHCAFYMKNNHVCLTPIKSAKTRVNGYLICEETLLNHGDRIELGVNHFFRLNCPIEKDPSTNSSLKEVTSLSDFKYAQEEILLSKIVNNTDEDAYHIYSDNTQQSSDSIDENSVNLEYAVKKIEQNYSTNSWDFMSTSSSVSSLEDYASVQTRKGLLMLREQLLHANSLAREANSICKEINEKIRFSVTLRIPAKNLMPNRKRESLLSEPAIIVKKSAHSGPNQNIIDLEKFENFIFQLREIYTEKIDMESEPFKKGIHLNEILDDYESNHNLIGVANVFLDSLFIEACILFEYDVPIVNQQGEISGLLKVKLQRINTAAKNESEANETQMDATEINESSNTNIFDRKLRFRLNIVEALDLPVHLNHSVFCKYQFWSVNNSYIVPSKLDSKHTSVKFDYENEFCIDIGEEFIEYCLDGALSIEILGQKEEVIPYNERMLTNHEGPKKYAEAVEKYNQMIKYQNLIDCWNEVSKALEVHIQILELNSEGNWSPVEVKQDIDSNATGGVYQLRQGQSRQISARINPTKSNSIMWYNGILFNLEPHKIDKISVGCVLGKEAGVTQPLDSYQDIDLINLREKCKEILEARKQYLYSQLKIMSDKSENQNEEDKERYESLCKQLVNLGEEQAAVDAPEDNSGLPGSTIEWEPATGMEHHVPIVFLDIEDESTEGNVSGDLNISDDYYEDDFENHSSISNGNYGKWGHEYDKHSQTGSRTLMNCGQECCLKFEQRDARYVDLKLVRWNDSSLVEMVANDEFQMNNSELTSVDYNDSETDADSFSLKAVSMWDSSIHQSPYLNQITPLDRNVYLTVKLNLKLKILTQNKNESKFKSNRYIDLVLRKRIAVNVISANANTIGNKFGLMRFKNFLGGGTGNVTKNVNSINKTSLTYRVISSIPRALIEIENRESLALQAASTLANDSISDQRFLEKTSTKATENSTDSSLNQFQQYAKIIGAVDSIFRQDRMQQQTAIRSAVNTLQQSNLNSTSEDLHSFSVPGLLKTGFDSIMNMSSLNVTQSTESVENNTTSTLSKKIASMGTQLFDTAISNNLSFKNLLEMPNKSNDPDAVYDELRQLELEIEETKRSKQINETKNLNYDDTIPEKLLVLPEVSETIESPVGEVVFDTAKPEASTQPEKQSTTNSIKMDLEKSIKMENKITKMIEEIDQIKTDVNESFNKINNVDKSNENKTTVEEKQEDKVKPEMDFNESSKLIENLDTKNLTNLKVSSSNNSIASTLTNLSQRTQPQWSIDELPEWVRMDAHVIVSTNSIQNKPGYVRFIGPTKFAHGTWIGVELEQAFGKNDGSLKGIRYFRCEENKGTFVRMDKLTLCKN